MQNNTFKILNMSCEHCVRTIETELSEIDGVHSVNADLTNKSVSIEWDEPAAWDEIKATLVEIKYPPTE